MANYNLYQCRTVQPFRVAIGKSTWKFYEFGDERLWNLREVLSGEIVVEFDSEDKNLTWTAINLTAINLYNAGFVFEIWDHQGKSPHLHIRNLPLNHLPKDELRAFKKFFITKYIPKEFIEWVDFSLCGIHLIAVENMNHWKGKYGVKELIYKFNPQEELK